MKPEIQLEEAELLKLENLQLKLNNVTAQGMSLQAQLTETRKKIETRLEIEDLRKYKINLETGHGVLVDKEEKE